MASAPKHATFNEFTTSDWEMLYAACQAAIRGNKSSIGRASSITVRQALEKDYNIYVTLAQKIASERDSQKTL